MSSSDSCFTVSVTGTNMKPVEKLNVSFTPSCWWGWILESFSYPYLKSNLNKRTGPVFTVMSIKKINLQQSLWVCSGTARTKEPGACSSPTHNASVSQPSTTFQANNGVYKGNWRFIQVSCSCQNKTLRFMVKNTQMVPFLRSAWVQSNSSAER